MSVPPDPTIREEETRIAERKILRKYWRQNLTLMSVLLFIWVATGLILWFDNGDGQVRYTGNDDNEIFHSGSLTGPELMTLGKSPRPHRPSPRARRLVPSDQHRRKLGTLTGADGTLPHP